MATPPFLDGLSRVLRGARVASQRTLEAYFHRKDAENAESDFFVLSGERPEITKARREK
jgi:hypothetical protein